MSTTINKSTLDQAQSLLNQGKVHEAWQTLAESGDNYALNAAKITDKNNDSFAKTLVQETWENTVGMAQYNEKFDAVAKQHLDNYLTSIRKINEKLPPENDLFVLPSTTNIEASYKKALESNGISTKAAIDGIINTVVSGADGLLGWTNWLDLFDGKWSNDYDIEDSRISDPYLKTDYSRFEAVEKIVTIGTESIYDESLDYVKGYLDNLYGDSQSLLHNLLSKQIEDQQSNLTSEQIDNSQLNLEINTNQTSGFAGSNDLTQTGNVIGDADWRALMKIDVVNGDGFKNIAMASMVSDYYRPGNQEISTYQNFAKDYGQQISNLDNIVYNNSQTSQNLFNNNTQLNVNLSNLTNNAIGARTFVNIDPVVLDLNGDGVKLTSYNDSEVTFDVDNDGMSERTGWVSNQDGILVDDVNHDGKINNITETISEYYNTKDGSVADADGKYSSDGLAALKKLDSNHDSKFNSSDAKWSDLRIWQDANGDGVTDAGELKTLNEAGIKEFDLSAITQASKERNAGNIIFSKTTYTTTDNQTKQVAAVDFTTNPIGYEFNDVNLGKLATSEDGTKSLVIGDVNGAIVTASQDTAQNIFGNIGNDTIIGDARDNWISGGAGSDSLQGGAGDDILIIDSEDKQQNIDGGDGRDVVIINSNQGVSFNLAQSHIETAVGGNGDDVLIGGGTSNVFIDGGSGDDIIIGGAADDALAGGDGDDYLDGGYGDDIIRGHRGNDVLIGGIGNDYLEGGLDDDKVFGGAGNDVIMEGGGNDEVDGGDGYDLVKYNGSYKDYKISRDGVNYKVQDLTTGNIDSIKNIEGVRFNDVTIKLIDGNISPLPVADVIQIQNKSDTIFISKDDLLKNDLDVEGDALTIISATNSTGGFAELVKDAGGNVLGVRFTPDKSFIGNMSFDYDVKDSKGAYTIITQQNNDGTSVAAAMKARVTFKLASDPTDDLYAKQWYLSEINIQKAWQDYTGSGVKIGVFEQGDFNVNHTELDGNTLQSYKDDVAFRQVEQFSQHATTVAGVIAAERNGTGIVGVAYDAKLEGYSWNADATGLANLKNVDIANNSWGAVGEFYDNFSDPNNLNSVYASLIEESVEQGRNGLGTINIFAGGNARASGDNVNYHNLQNSRFVITTGSINQPGDLATLTQASTPFSTPGDAILVSAPGSNISSTGNLLTNANGSTFLGEFSSNQGTSFSAPIISGVVALMLQANPNLGYRDVQKILALSARQFNDPNTTWQENGATNWNGGAMHFSHDYGFGEVDAAAAVRLAETWNEVSDSYNENSFSASDNFRTLLQDNGVITKQFTISNSNLHNIETVEVQVNLTDLDISDLTIKLISPSGTESILMDKPGSSVYQGGLSFNFSSRAFLGENVDGDWKLQITDSKTGDISYLNSWQLKFYGDLDDGTNDTYIYTDEFAKMIDGTRGIIIDSDGGIDTINAAAVSSDSIINLNAGQISNIAGKDVLITGGIKGEQYYQQQSLLPIKQAQLATVNSQIGVKNQALAADNTEFAGIDVAINAKYSEANAKYAEYQTAARNVANDWLSQNSFWTAYTDGSSSYYIYRNNSTGAQTTLPKNEAQQKINNYNGLITTQNQKASEYQSEVSQYNSLLTRRDALPNEISGLQNDIVTLTKQVSQLQSDINFINAYLNDFNDGKASMIENAYAGDGNDTIIGNDQDNKIWGGRGSNTETGGVGKDTFIIKQNAATQDVITDFKVGEDKIDLSDFKNLDLASLNLSQLANDVIISFESGQKIILQNLQVNQVSVDSFVGITGAVNVIDGTVGNDVLNGTARIDLIKAGAGNDTILGLLGDDYIDGGAGDDILLGGDGNDILIGGSGNNQLHGGKGNDIIDFGTGAESSLTDSVNYGFGEEGSDSFVISDKSIFLKHKYDVIVDFDVNDPNEKIDLSRIKGVDQYSDLQIFQNGADAYVAMNSNIFGYAELVKLENVNIASLNSSKFIITNEAPQAANDVASTNEDSSVIINLLSNDSDDKTSLKGSNLTIITNPIHGLLTINSDGTTTYKPNANFNGTDFFEYKIIDSGGLTSSKATVNLTVNPVNDAPVIVSIIADQKIYITKDINLKVDNFFTEVDGESLSYSVTLADGSNLPSWLSFNSQTLILSGQAPISASTFNVKITATDQSGFSNSETFKVTVDDSILFGTTGDDTLNGTENIDVINGDTGNDIINGLGGNDILYGAAGNDQISGGYGDDKLYGEDGDDILKGDVGKDLLDGGNGNDKLYSSGSGSDDTLTGGAGSDTFIIGNDIISNDVITDFNISDPNEKIDLSAFKDVATDISQLTMDQIGSDTKISFAGQSKTILVKNVSLSQLTVAKFIGLTDNKNSTGSLTINGTSGNDTLVGGSGDDIIKGNNGNDTIKGGLGSNLLTGGVGDDIFVISKNPGKTDVITDLEAFDSVQFDGFATGVKLSDFAYTENGNSVTFNLGEGQNLMFQNIKAADVLYYFSFISQTSLSDSSSVISYTGTAGNDKIVITTNSRNGDSINGGDGNDLISGNQKDDIIIGGKGNDILRGGDWCDIFQIDKNPGDKDTILDLAIKDMPDSIVLKGFSNTNLASYPAVQNGNDVVVDLGDGQTLTIKNFKVADVPYIASYSKDIYVSSNNVSGTDGDDLISRFDIGSSVKGTVIMNGGKGNDVLKGSNFDKDYFVIDKNSGDKDFVRSIDTSNGDKVIFRGFGDDILNQIKFLPSSDSYTLIMDLGDGQILRTYGVQQSSFSTYFDIEKPFLDATDGNDILKTGYLSVATIDGKAGDDIITGNDLGNNLSGGDGNDVINSGSGNDNIYGGDGNDVINDKGGNNIIEGGAGNDIINTGAGTDIINGGAGDDIINGGDGGDTINGGDGNDKLYSSGSGSNDILTGGLGSDIFVIGNDIISNDIITDFDVTDPNEKIDLSNFATSKNGFSTLAKISDLNITQVGNDAKINFSSASKTITIKNVKVSDLTADKFYLNNLPTATITSATINEDASTTIDVLSAASDLDNDVLSISAIGSASHGVATIVTDAQGKQKISYIPTVNYYGTDSFAYTISDGRGGTVTKTISVQINSVNDLPVVTLDSAITNEDTKVILDVLAYSSDVDGDTLSISSVTNGAHGQVLSFTDSDGKRKISYTPTTNYNGSDSFTYKISDGHGGIVTKTVSVNISAVNDVPTATLTSVTTNEDNATILDVLAFASDVDGDVLIISGVTAASHAAVSIINSSDGKQKISYIPQANYNGNDSFSYTISDGHGGEIVKTVTVNVISVNDVPIALITSAVTNEDTPTILDVLASASDVEGDILSITNVGTATHGFTAIFIDSDGYQKISYTPVENYNGLDYFTYKISDGHGGVVTKTVSVNVVSVNDAPTITKILSNVTTNEDSVFIIITADKISAAFADADVNDYLTYAITSVNGITTIPSWLSIDNNNGEITSNNPTNEDVGNYNIIITATDLSGLAISQSFFLTVNNVNDAPTASITSIATNEDNLVKIDVLSAASDIDASDILSLTSVTNGLHGTASIITDDNGNKVISYVPNANYNGSDIITYTISDNNGASVTKELTVTVSAVNDAPIIVSAAQNQTVQSGKAFTYTLSNNLFSDVDGDSLTIKATLADGSPLPSWLSFDGSKFSGTPNVSLATNFAIKLMATDPSGASISQNFGINVTNPNNAPIAKDDVFSMNEDASLTISFASILKNDSDVEDKTNIQKLTKDNIIFHNPGNGTITVTDSGIIYTPKANYNGSDSLTYQIKDSSGALSNMALINLTIKAVNDAPVAASDSFVTDEDTAITIKISDLLANDSDVEDGVNIQNTTFDKFVFTNPGKGVIVKDAVNGTITYTPNKNYNGSDVIYYQIKDSSGVLSNKAAINLTVNAVNDGPLAVNDVFATNEDTPLTITFASILKNDSDVEDGVNIKKLTKDNIVFGDSVNGTITITDTGIIYAPNKDFNGSDVITYQIKDSGGDLSNVASINLTIKAVNDIAVAGNDSFIADEDKPITIKLSDLLANDSDIEDGAAIQNLTLDKFVFSNPAKGKIVKDVVNNVIIYTPNKDYNGADSLTYQIKDSNGALSNKSTISLTINSVNDAPVISTKLTDKSVKAGNLFNYTLPTNSFIDADKDALTYSAKLADGSDLPSWLKFDYVTKTFSGISPSGVASLLSIKVIASDGSLDASQSFSLNITSNVINGTVKNETLNGTALNDEIYGNDGIDNIKGNAGNDLIIGGKGADVLLGGAGNDQFIFKNLTDSTINESDLILDFIKGEDKINLSGLGFHDIGGSSELSLAYYFDGKNTVIDDPNSNFAVKLAGEISLDHNDFAF
ncbi:MAG: tandem-95 repeat protein [Pseudomonadota bacterium]